MLSHIKISYNICAKQQRYLIMYLSKLHNIIDTGARNLSAQRVGHVRTGLCEHAPSIQHVNNPELREISFMKESFILHIITTLKCILEL